MKIFNSFWLLFCVVTLFVACERDIDSELNSESESGSDKESDNDEVDTEGNVVDHDASSDYIWDSSDVTNITLNGSSIEVDGEGASVAGSVVTIDSVGTYNITGTLSDGQVYVDTEEDGIVRLILNGVDVSCSSNAPFYVQQAEKTMIVLAEGTENTFADGSNYSSSEEDANAAIFSKDDLTIYGEGSLSVTGNYNDGITSKDGLIITSGNINVEAVDDGIRGKDYLIIKDGDIVVDVDGDGLKSDNDENTAKGYITIENGEINITSGADGIQAETDVIIESGQINIKSGGGSSASLGYDESAKGIKSGVSTVINDGLITVDAADDALHSDGYQEFNDGVFTIASGDDGIHSDYNLTIESGDFFITESYEGLESYLGNIYINGGNIDIVASDDGINISAGGASSWGGGRKSTSSTYELNISGGSVVVDCNGDGLDSNDQIDINGGTVLVNSSSTNENSALDYDGSCAVNGGLLIAIGTTQMAQAPGSSSSQYAVMVTFRSRIQSGKIIHVEDEEGNAIFTYQTIKIGQSLVFSSPELTKGTSYSVYTGGSSTGTLVDGLYTNGTYTAGSKYTDFTISRTITTVN